MTYAVRNLGSVILRTDGAGLYTDKARTIACRDVVVCLDTDIMINPSGAVDFANGHFMVDMIGWDTNDGHPYTDYTFERGVRDFLSALGLPPSVEWSERGRQGASYADFDVGYDLLEALFPAEFYNSRLALVGG